MFNFFQICRRSETYERRRRDTRYSREINDATSLALESAGKNVTLSGLAKNNLTSSGLDTNGSGNGTVIEKNEKQSIKNGTFYQRIYQEVNVSTLSFVIKELRHYSMYSISVRACRESFPADSLGNARIENCSTEAIVHQRTKKIGKSDKSDERSF